MFGYKNGHDDNDDDYFNDNADDDDDGLKHRGRIDR